MLDTATIGPGLVLPVGAAAVPSHQPPRAWLGLSSSRLVQTNYLALPVGAAAGPSHQQGKVPEHGWACRAADLFEPTT